nr:hypothetical protein [Tanacetum cinerariifolium]
MSSFNRRECLGRGQPCKGYHCCSCTCPKCGVILLTGICINYTYGDGKPVTCCVCEGPLRGGFCLFCNSKAENSFTYNPNAYSFNDTSSNFNLLPQPQYETYLCKLCGNNSHDGYDCQQQFPFVYEQEPSYNQNYNDNYYSHDLPSFLCCDNCGGSHATFQCQPMDQNNDSSCFDQIQPSQYPVFHHPSQEMNEEVLQDKEKFMQDTQTFLEKFNRYSFENQKIPELMCKLREDVRNIREELAEYINSSSWNSPTFFYDDDEEYSIQYKEYLEKFTDAVTTVLPTEEPEYSLSMGYEHLSTTKETEFDEVTESSAKNLLPIPSGYEVTSDDESECEVPVKDDSSLAFTTFSNPLFDDNDDLTSSDDESLSDEDVLIEEFKVYSNSLFDDEEINSDEIDPHCFNAESDFVESLSNRDTLIDSSPKFDYLEEFSSALMPTSIVDEEQFHANTILETLPTSPIPVEDSDSQREEIDIFLDTDELLPPGTESDGYDSEGDIYFLERLLVNDSIPLPENESSNFDHQDNPLFPRPPPEPPDVEFCFDLEPDSGELIATVKNNNDELNEDNCFDP